MEEKETYLKKMAKGLEHLDAKISELKARAEKATGEAQVDFQKRLEELRTKQEAARQKLKELRETGGAKWGTIKTRAQKAWDDLSGALEKAKEKFIKGK